MLDKNEIKAYLETMGRKFVVDVRIRAYDEAVLLYIPLDQVAPRVKNGFTSLRQIKNLKRHIGERFSTRFGHTDWKLAANKEHLADAKKGQRLKVHGLLVHGEKPRLTKGYRKKIRAYKHLLATDRVKPEHRRRIIGHIKFAESVDNWKAPVV